jgi:glycosyltransferase involved in cell wall biosynthesis
MTNKNILIVLPTDTIGGAEIVLKTIAEHLAPTNNVHVVIQRQRALRLFEFARNKVVYSSPGRLHWSVHFLANIWRLRKIDFDYAITSASHVNALIGFFRRVKILHVKYFVARESTSTFTRRDEMNLFKEKCYYRLGYPAIDLLVCQTAEMKKQLVDNLPWLDRKTNVQVIPNPVDLTRVLEKSNEPLPMPTPAPFIVAAGRFHAVKGFDVLVKAFSMLKHAHGELKLVILGEKNGTRASGDLGVEIERLVRETGLERDVILHGAVENVYPFFKQARACVVSSRVEGFPNVLLQMMSRNEKVVSTLCAGDIDKLEGVFTCKPDDAEDLSRAMKACLEADTSHNRTRFDKELQGRSIESFMSRIENFEHPRPRLVRVVTVARSWGLLKRQLRFMSDHFEVTGVSSPGKDLEYMSKDEGVRGIPVTMTRKITPLQDLKALWRLYRLFRDEKPCIVHAHTPKAGTIGMLAAWLARVPHRLHTVAGLPLLEARGSKRRLLNLVEKITYKCATRVYPNSRGLMDIILKERFCPRNKLKVLANGSSNGIDTSFFDPSRYTSDQRQAWRRELAIDAADFVFIFVGRLVSDKGINELVAAFDAISRERDHVKLLLVGREEPDLDPLKKETSRRVAANENIIAVGHRDDVRPFLAIANALVFPSYREGFPNVVMQAGAMGLPSIVTNINGCNEIIVDGQNGVIVPAKDTCALEKKMELFITDKVFTNRLHANARAMIVSRYQQRIVWESLLAEYKTLVNP